MAVNFGYRRDRAKTAALMLATAAFGATFVGMQGFRMDQADHGGRPALGAIPGARRSLVQAFHDHWLPRTTVTIGVIFLIAIDAKVCAGRLRCGTARFFFNEQEGGTTRSSKSRPVLALRRSCVVFIFAFFIFGEVGRMTNAAVHIEGHNNLRFNAHLHDALASPATAHKGLSSTDQAHI